EGGMGVWSVTGVQSCALPTSPSESVGVVADVKSHLDDPAPPTAFVPAAEAQAAISNLFEGWFPRTLIVRAAVDPLSLERQVRARSEERRVGEEGRARMGRCV